MKNHLIMLYAICSILTLLVIEQGIGIPYIGKTISKIILLLVIPLFIFRKKGFLFLQLRKTSPRSLKYSFFLGLTVMLLIILTFITLRPLLNLDALLFELAQIGVTATIFPIVALYILLGNSLLEEFFFRGLLPASFHNKWFRLLIPSLLFTLYHIAIFLTWFSLPLLVIALTGLWVGGITFQLVNERSKTILPSWTIHIFADLAVILIGIYLFYIYWPSPPTCTIACFS